MQREPVEAARPMLVAARRREGVIGEAQAITLAARMRGDDPRGQLFEALLELPGYGREVEHALVRGWGLIGLHQQPATPRVRAPGHLSRRVAAAELAQARPFLVAHAMHG